MHIHDIKITNFRSCYGEHYFNFDDYNKEDIQECLEKILLDLEYKPETDNLYMDLYDSESVDVFRLSFEIQKKINRGEIG